jgi:hypothetical protein
MANDMKLSDLLKHINDNNKISISLRRETFPSYSYENPVITFKTNFSSYSSVEVEVGTNHSHSDDPDHGSTFFRLHMENIGDDVEIRALSEDGKYKITTAEKLGGIELLSTGNSELLNLILALEWAVNILRIQYDCN